MQWEWTYSLLIILLMNAGVVGALTVIIRRVIRAEAMNFSLQQISLAAQGEILRAVGRLQAAADKAEAASDLVARNLEQAQKRAETSEE